jgi:hypothetical protein
MDFGDELPLNTSIPTEQWAFMTRRLHYLEAVVVQILGDRSLLREWYTAGELAELRLPGLPLTRPRDCPSRQGKEVETPDHHAQRARDAGLSLRLAAHASLRRDD